MLDADLKFRTNINQLFSKFEKFSFTNIIGIAHEQHSIYKHITWAYRRTILGQKLVSPLLTVTQDSTAASSFWTLVS